MSEEAEQVSADVQAEAVADDAVCAPAPEPQTAVVDAEPAAEPKPASTESKTVSFDNKPLTFDEAQEEIDSIKSRAATVRRNVRQANQQMAAIGYTGKSSHQEEDVPKSKNMLSHLNSEQAMLNYKVQTARSLVRKQEDLLRNLSRMRENMERSEVELGKASDYYTPRTRLYPRRYGGEPKSYSVPRKTYREPSPSNIDVPSEPFICEVTSEASPVHQTKTSSYASSLSPLIQRRYPEITTDVEMDADFEREMAALRKRVSDITRKATEATSSSSRGGYDYYDSTSYLKGYGEDIITPEVKYPTAPSSVSCLYEPSYSSLYSTNDYLPEPTVHTTLPSSYSQYVLSALDEYPPAVYQASPSKDTYPSYGDLGPLYDDTYTDYVY